MGKSNQIKINLKKRKKKKLAVVEESAKSCDGY
jgi:hypothetical protein